MPGIGEGNSHPLFGNHLRAKLCFQNWEDSGEEIGFAVMVFLFLKKSRYAHHMTRSSS